MRLGGPQSRFGRGAEEKNFQPLPGFKPLICEGLINHFLIKECYVNLFPDHPSRVSKLSYAGK
jgi:hypothetical protein